MKQDTLDLAKSKDASVECLGQTFPSNEARREHYLQLLAEKLKDPEFRKIDGFPIGEDEDILALSDPPYYTICPNPWISDFIKHHGRPYDPNDKYHREPLAIDVSVGKTDPIYKAHSYHTKVPHLAIVPSILHYTEPGDVVLDAFAGSGMTGVAAQCCANPPSPYRRELESSWKSQGRMAPKWGVRCAVLNDLSPAATFIAANFNIPLDVDAFADAGKALLEAVEHEIGWMYETLHSDGCTKGRIEYTVWSQVYSCPDCAGEVNFTEEALDVSSKRVKDTFECPHCSTELSKTKLQRLFVSHLDASTGRTVSVPKRAPVLISYTVGKKRHEKRPDAMDVATLKHIGAMSLPSDVPTIAIPKMHMTHERARMDYAGVTHIHHFYLPRAAQAMGLLWQKARSHPDARIRSFLLFMAEQGIGTLSLLNRYRANQTSQSNQILNGVYYIPSQIAEISISYRFDTKLNQLAKTFQQMSHGRSVAIVNTGTAAQLPIPDNSVDYVFTDPPFGENIYYSDLNFLVEAWHGVVTDSKPEAIIDRCKGKRLPHYQQLMQACFAEYYRVLKPGRWMTVVFSNSRAAVWNSIQVALQQVGFVVCEVTALDKKQGSYRQVTSPTAVKQDLVISAYKPNGGLEDRFRKSGHTIDGVWDFVRTHLRNIPVVKISGGELEFISERDARILYDRMVAFYVGHGVPVPLSAAEFQAALVEKFPEREAMFFLPEQVAEWDKKRAKMHGVGQMSIFVEDERSAIDWLRSFLRSRPSTIADIAPEFMQQLGASWKEFETRPELSLLLQQNFLRYDGKGEVPSQIHSYLSTQNKDLRNLPKDDPRLQSRAKDRWFVPDPAKAVDVEAVRNKRLLQEFWELCAEAGITRASASSRQPALPLVPQTAPKKTSRKKLKEVRTEAVRLGFKECFAAKDYATILGIAAHLPENVIEEDEQLQMMHDMAEMRVRG